MKNVNLQKKQLSSEIDRIVSNGMNSNFQPTPQPVQDVDFSWDDLNNLKNDLGNTIIGFMGEITKILGNSEVISKLGEKTEHFQKLVKVFFDDLNTFSEKVKELRVQHETRTGKIADLNDFNLYNRLAIAYHSLYNELIMLMSPTLSDLVLTISETSPQQPETPKSEVTHVQ